MYFCSRILKVRIILFPLCAKVWGYSGNWKSFTPDASGNDGGSGDLNTISAGSGYWFLLKDLGSVNLELSPKGAVGSELVIGGATSLTPPEETQVIPSITRLLTVNFLQLVVLH